MARINQIEVPLFEKLEEILQWADTPHYTIVDEYTLSVYNDKSKLHYYFTRSKFEYIMNSEELIK